MSDVKRIRVLYLAGGSHLYGDNRSLLGLISQIKDNVEILVGVTEKGLFSDELEKMSVPYVVVRGNMSPSVQFSYIHYTWFQRIKRKLGYWKRYILASRILPKVISSFKPDIIHSNNSLVFSGAIMAKKFNIPCVWHIREYITLDHKAIFPNRLFFDENIAISHCIAITKGIYRHFNLTEGKDVQIYNGVCSKKDIRPCVKMKEKYFLYLGRIVPTKGIDDMIEAFSLFCRTNNDITLLVAGDGPNEYMYKLKSKLDNMGISDRVRFLGFRRDVSDLLRSALALIVPSIFEAMGRITAEAMLAGCYVIGRNTAGTKELLENHHTGMLFNSVADLAMAMEQVSKMSNEELYKCVYDTQEQTREIYTNERNAYEVFSFYNKILNTKVRL